MNIKTVNEKLDKIIKEVKKYKNNIRIISYDENLEYDDPNKCDCICDTCNSSFKMPYKMYWTKSCPICNGEGLNSIQKQDVSEIKAKKVKKKVEEISTNINRREISKELNNYIEKLTSNLQHH